MSERPSSTFAPCEVPLPGGVLVLAPLRRFGLAAPEAGRAGSALLLLRGDPEAFARLRRDWLGLDLGGDPYRLSPQEMMSALEVAVAGGRLGAAFFPYVINPVAELSANLSPPGAPPAPAPVAVRDMSRDQRIGAMLKLVPKHLKDDALKEAFLQLITPTAIGIMVGSLVALLVGHAFGYGEVADVALAAFAYTLAGLAGVEALYGMVAAVWDACKAQTDTELDAAADRFAVALAVLGVTILLFLVSRSRSKSRTAPREPPPRENTGENAKSDGRLKSDGAKQTGSNATPESRTQATLDRIARGERDPHRNDGSVFRNKEGLLPTQPEGYYQEYVYRSPGSAGPGAERVIVGAGGDVYYTPDHYESFQQMR